MANALSIATGIITGLVVAVFSSFGFFALLIVLNGFQEKDAVWGIIAYGLVALVSVLATSWFSFKKISSGSPTTLQVILAIVTYSLKGFVASAAGVFLGAIVTNVIS